MNTQRHIRLVWSISLFALLAPLCSAQVDLAGMWAARNYADAIMNRPGPGPSPVDFGGIPMNDAARTRALSYSTSQISMPDRVCAPWAPTYLMISPFSMRIWSETEPRNGGIIAWKIGGTEDRDVITIWMDGRPHPSVFAPHEIGGFTTGKWENDVLVAHTTHMREGFLRRNGVATSDNAEMTMWFLRHDSLLTLTARIDDPAYLSEPFFLTRIFQIRPIVPGRTTGLPCIQGYEGVEAGAVPHFLPGKNPFVEELTKIYNIPLDGILGGPETMYPDYRKKVLDQYQIPAKCARYCGGPGQFPFRAD
jgi:hypothetical protein